jgi:hypothetical protein
MNSQFEEDAIDLASLPKEEKLSKLALLVQELDDAQAAVEAAEQDLEDKKAEVKRLEEVAIPELMTSINAKKFELTNGVEVKVEKDYYACISPEKKQAAMDWLFDNGHEHIVKNAITCAFKKNENDMADALAELLTTSSFKFTRDLTVHWQTLRAFVKEMHENGGKVPEDLFGVHITDKASITKKKEKK